MMATKSANVTARIQPEIKRQAEAVLDRIGLPVSVLIDTLYRQIIMTGGVPYSLTVPKLPTRDSLTDEQFNAMMEKGCNQAKPRRWILCRQDTLLPKKNRGARRGSTKCPLKIFSFIIFSIIQPHK